MIYIVTYRELHLKLLYGYGWAMDKDGRTYVYCVHWAQNAQIRPVRFFSNFKGPVHSSVGCYIEDILC